VTGDGYSRWCAANGCDHAHCPYGDEHPQPLLVVMRGETVERLICGRCWFVDRLITDMVPCTPAVCD
jgi:hypothetical protein